MSTQPRSPAEHYAESQRLLEVAEDAAIDPGIRDLAARMATAHAAVRSDGVRKRAAPPSGRTARVDSRDVQPLVARDSSVNTRRPKSDAAVARYCQLAGRRSMHLAYDAPAAG